MHLKAIQLPFQPITLAGSRKGNWNRVQHRSSGQNSLQLQPSVNWEFLWNFKTRLLFVAKTSFLLPARDVEPNKGYFPSLSTF
jgi:hypothetical protein